MLGRENLSITFLLLETRLEEKAELRSGTEPARSCQHRLSMMKDCYPMPPYSEGCYRTDSCTY